MNTARIVVLAIAIGAGGIAAYLASGSDKPAPAQPVAQLATVDVLVAKGEINLGQTVKAEDMQWQTWPTASASNSFVKRSDRPDAPNQLAGSIARGSFMAGEPIREQKLVKTGSGFMAAILPSGMRAVSTEIAPETGAGGFILPNDRVDVLLTQRLKNPDPKATQPDIVHTEVVLRNVRVLAIDQAPREKDGQNTVVGKTVTLELKPDETTTLAASRQAGTLSLALRSIADANTVETVDASVKFTQSVNIVRFGIPGGATLMPTQP
ncbi:Flp pilus assembly protein CpaB [Bradyrhizobium sp. Tv2a-2]|uniref:Flp pilus assembly protein CpaB n=1 Tax=Bradyrhizobium sp. Tv2a-2 TaxID=113395 RepID=UPI0003FB9A07|nr:Flp pilus assembly protein CpaB [Bradyrhizobium sp. Tv2a-2]